MQFIRPACFVVSVLIVSAACRAQDWRDDDSIWGFGHIGGPHREGPRAPDPAPILPTDWIAVPEASGEPALLAFPWILEPERAAPRHGEDGWTVKLAPPLAAAACAYAVVVSEADEVRMARLTGARWLVVNGSVHIGDPERRGDRGVPVALKKGENRVFVVDATAGWELELWKPATRMVIGTWDVGWPHVTGAEEDIEYPVFNASVEAAPYLHVHYGHLYVPTATCKTWAHEWRDGGFVAPLGLLVRGHYYDDIFGGCHPTPGRAGNQTAFCVYGNGDDEAAREIVRDSDPSYERTRLSPRQRELGRARLVGRPQASIPKEGSSEYGERKFVVLVHGTHGTAEETQALLARARLDQQVLWYECGESPLVVPDTVYSKAREPRTGTSSPQWIDAVIGSRPVVLYGNSSSNGAWKDSAFNTPAVEVASNRLSRGGETTEGDDIAGTVRWTSPDSLTAMVVPPFPGFASTGVRGARLSLALGMLAAQDDFVRVDPDSASGFSPLPTGK